MRRRSIIYYDEALNIRIISKTVTPIIILNKTTKQQWIKRIRWKILQRELFRRLPQIPRFTRIKKSKFFGTQNRFKILVSEEQETVFMQTDTQFFSPTIKTSSKQSKDYLLNILLKNV